MNDLEKGKGIIIHRYRFSQLRREMEKARQRGFSADALLRDAGVELNPVPIEENNQEQPGSQVEPEDNMEPEA